MQFTIRGKLLPTKDEESKLNTLSRVFPSMVRFAYNRLLEKHKTYDVVKMLYDKFIPNARWCQWAVKEAQANINSQKELLPLYIEDLKRRLERAKRRLVRTKHPLRQAGIKERVKKLERKLDELEPYVKWNGRKVAGIDANPMGIAVTVVSKDGNLLASKLIGNLVKKAFRWLRSHGVNTIAIEDLDIKKTLDEGVPTK